MWTSSSRRPWPRALTTRSGSSVSVPASADPRDPVRVVHAVASVDANGATSVMPAYRVSLVADTPDLAVVVPANDDKDVKLLTDAFDLHASLEGGRVTVERRTLPGVRRRFGFQAGPPFGISLFVMKGVAPSGTSMGDIYRAALPFLACDVIAMALIITFPTIALWLPSLNH